MIESELKKFFDDYFKYFVNLQEKKPSHFYHLPCIFMDHSDFIPASNEKIINQVLAEFTMRNFKSNKLEVKSFELSDINKASPSLFRIKINFDVFDTALAKSRYCQALFTLMKKGDEYKIVTTEFLNLRVPSIEGITYNKSHELHTKFAKYMKPSTQVI